MKIEVRHEAVFGGGWDVAAVRALLDGACRVVLVAHTNADGDAVGSVLGMAHLLRKATGATVTAMLPDGCPADLAWLPGADSILGGKADAERCTEAVAGADLVMGLDISGWSRTGVLEQTLAGAKARKMIVDHHERSEQGEAGDEVAVVEPDISSTCELVYWLMWSLYGDGIFTKEAATCLFTGICTDTGTFTYSNDRPSVYLAAAALLAFGIDPMYINREIKNVFSVPRLRFFGHAMDSLLTVYPRQEVALMVITAQDMRDYGVESHELTGLINEVMKLKAVDCGILVREEEGKVRLSLRSKVRYDVNRLAGELFGGGGHKRAAGATSTLNLADTVRTVKDKLKLALCIACFLIISCNNVPVVDTAEQKGNDLTENLINANRYIAQTEEAQIDSYAERRGWTMATLPSGTRVMVTEEGKGKEVQPDETVVISYRVESLGGQTIYDYVTDTVVAGRLQPTRGLDDALLTLRHGSRARVILPSEQAYGLVGDGDRIGQRVVLVYELRVDN